MHCDIKLENILVNVAKDGSDKIADLCIADFGLSSVIQQLTAGIESRGSLPYMAPEQLISGETFSSKIDSWSLGVILHELLV